MSKSKSASDADVLTNRLSLGLARHQNLLASWTGMQAASAPSSAKDEQDEGDLKQESFGHDKLGVGGPLPKNVADGSFTKSAPTSNDKLLEQLIGKKRAKAHVAAQQQAARPVATQNTFGNNKTKIKKDDSEDEDEGRAAAFQSKRRKPNQKSKPQVTAAKGGDEDEDVSKPQTESNDVEDVLESSNEDAKNAANDEEDVSVTPNSKAMPSRTKVKPKSFLDEILAEKSSKKSRKAKNKAQAGP